MGTVFKKHFTPIQQNKKMAKIFISGSSDGLGLLAAQSLMNMGHRVVMHARNEERKEALIKKFAKAENILIGDLSKQNEIIRLAEDANGFGKFDAVIHNAGVYNASAKDIFTVNVLAPYMLTCLMQASQRLIYVSSDMHLGGQSHLEKETFPTNQMTYSDSKLLLLMLCKAFANKWNKRYINALHPGWVPTKMGGKGAPDDLKKGYETQVWLAVSEEAAVKVSGEYFFHLKKSNYHKQADDVELQAKLIAHCEKISAVQFNL